MPYIPPEVVERAREMDLLTYLKSYEPQELVNFGGNTYCTREHDSLKISNGKWCWFSRGIGGYSALDYLIKVKDMPFMQAVETIMGNVAVSPPTFTPAPSKPKEKVLLLPKANRCATHAVEYLHGRGIDYELIDFCISTGRLYESYPYHNVVFVGQDRNGKPRYANLRGIGSDFIGDANGSDKHYSFGIPAAIESDTLHLFESAVDLLSYGTIQKLDGKDWRRENLLSLAGVYKPKARIEESSLPVALVQYLADYPHIRKIDPNGLSLKMLKICSPLIGDGTLRPFSIRWPKSAIISNTDCLIHASTAFRKTGSESTLSLIDILEPTVDEKYFLSTQATARLLYS